MRNRSCGNREILLKLNQLLKTGLMYFLDLFGRAEGGDGVI